MEIDVFYDIVCPWCFIGKRRLFQALARRPGARPKVHWRAFLLNPHMPAEGIERDIYLIRKFGSESRIRRLQGALLEASQSVEIPFAFDRIRRTPNSVNAHRLAFFAAREDAADATVEALFRAYFLEGRDIGEIDVLAGIGAECGLDRDAVAAYLAGPDDIDRVNEENGRAHRLGVNGVPAFVFNRRFVISGAQDPQVLARMADAAEAAGAAA
jgi:predicted DsbA family dithiol-disulfide isomerase